MQGALSERGDKIWRALRMLPPAEALGVMCMLLDEVGSEVGSRGGPAGAAAAELMDDVSAFAAGVAKRCREVKPEGDK